MRIFVSHSSTDSALAASLVTLLTSALPLEHDDVLCTSVDGHRLPAGVDINQQLKREVEGADLLIGLLTPHALSSMYVAFELGARWGNGRDMIPVLAGGIRPSNIDGPLAAINCLDGTNESQIHQLLEESARTLSLTIKPASTYAVALVDFRDRASVAEAASSPAVDATIDIGLPADAQRLLVAAESDGYIIASRSIGGRAIQAGSQTFNESGDRRTVAHWEAMIDELESRGLIEATSFKREVFQVTDRGYKLIDELKQ